MKKNYLLFVFIAVFSFSYGQENCSGADSDLVYAYSHIKSAYNSNNIYHLKEYAYKSLEAFKRAKPKLKACGCETAYNKVYDAIELLEQVENANTNEDGRFYVKRTREIAKASFTEMDKCTALLDQKTSTAVAVQEEDVD
ncbi:hypothetical protein ACFFU9_10480 [Mariniflexile ostreae]|uniref:Uncharacterized protein n=1 Tax=Mariniflexile ostreae TaxID=1520892 RepID=A0ABV5FCI7_9FLAO